ncbi:MAG: hypothetical protein JXA11_15515 [Phycisphaerae bacterium]|nr:hypothetical protein [Phycisphaerae bacterium]
MGKRPKDKPLDQSWMLTFCDCMTLLLCFFVLLLSFSSFDEVKFDTLSGAFRSMSFDWLEADPQRPKTSIVQHQHPKDFPRHGPTIPTQNDDHDQPNREPIEMLDQDLYKDRTVFYLPARRFFWGQGVNLTVDGKDYLHSLARLLRELTCRVVVAESNGKHHRNLGLRRAWAVQRWLVKNEQLDPERFTITAQGEGTRRFGDQPVLELTLMNVQVEE